MPLLHKNNNCLTNDKLRASDITTSEYARRLLVAEQLVKLGCKWPILHEQLSLRVTDAQRLMQESMPEGYAMARLEKGLSWFKVTGKSNLRMLHATVFFKIFIATENNIPDANSAEVLLYAFKQYKSIVQDLVFDNINRAWFMISSLKKNAGFSISQCQECNSDYVGIKFDEHHKCPACERSQYIQCEQCEVLIEKPYVPGTNAAKRTSCDACAEVIRKQRRKLRDKRRNIYVSTAILH